MNNLESRIERHNDRQLAQYLCQQDMDDQEFERANERAIEAVENLWKEIEWDHEQTLKQEWQVFLEIADELAAKCFNGAEYDLTEILAGALPLYHPFTSLSTVPEKPNFAP